MENSSNKKLRIGWFSFTCSEDSTILFTELMNEHWQEWMKVLDVRHAKILQSDNILDELDVAFVEGAISASDQEEKLKEIRSKSKKLVAIGACAVTGMPSAQRNEFPEEVREEIDFLIERFHYGKKVKRLEEVVRVDAKVPGCPMNEKKFLEILEQMLKEFGIVN